MNRLILTFIVIASTSFYSQEFSFIKLPFNFNNQLYYGKILSNSTINSDTLHCYYSYANLRVYHSESFDKGKNWSSPENIGFWKEFDILNIDNKSVLCFISLGTLRIKTFDANGNIIDNVFPVGGGISNLQIRKIGNGVGVFFSRLNEIYAVTSNDLIRWSLSSNPIYSDVNSFQLLKLKNDKFFLAFTKQNQDNLYYSFSDDLFNWQMPQILLSGISDTTKFVVEQNDASILILAFVKNVATPFSEHIQKDIFVTTSVDNGNNWSSNTSITKFKGDDNLLSITPFNDKFIISFSSKRDDDITNYFFGFLPSALDRITPPYIYEIKCDTSNLTNSKIIKFTAMIDDDEPLRYVKLKVKINNEIPLEIYMNDYGFDGDDKKFDKIYSTAMNLKLTNGDALVYNVIAEDFSGNVSISESERLFIPIDYQMTTYSLQNNRFHLSFDNKGNLADVIPNHYGNFDNGRVLFAGGFLLSGFENGNLFSNAVFSAGRIYDYYPGIVGGSKEDPKNQIYIIRKDDPPFGESWQLYKYATLLNAPFYDGDFDGVYNPVDKNYNGLWDENEDAPEILGDITTWCVFNDAVPSYLRRYGTNPVGIEIQQSVFSFDKNDNNQPDEKIYVRYRIINRGTVNEILDSVIFSFFIDPDIGLEYFNDYLATDTTLNLVYSYSGSETDFGINPPASGVAILQGPPVFIPGETFIDINSDGVFQSDTDIAIDTAFIKNGSGIAAKKFPGAKNADMSSSYSFTFSGISDPMPRYNQLGLNDYGQLIDVCNDARGSVFGNYNCSEINQIFHYSGNPVIPDGWVMNIPDDIRYLLSTGFFQLKKDEPVDIWGVYVAGRGVDSLDSITELKKNTQSAKKFYNEFPVNPERTPPPVEILPAKYVLYQNYPNPFNSGTKIKFEIPSAEHIRLKLYDITGREVATLLNEVRPAGSYDLVLSGNNLSSGVYFYQIIAGNFISTKKCVVLR